MTLGPSNQLRLYYHNDIFKNFVRLENINKLPNKILLSGEKGIGKSTLAYHLINFILSKNEENRYDLKNNEINQLNRSFKLIQNGSNPNFHLLDINQDKKNIDINQVRELILDLNKSSFNQKKRFVLIDNIELLNRNSANALLKILEEPNQNIYFILINNNKKILQTLKSRCLNFKVFLKHSECIEIVNKVMNLDLHNLFNNKLINNYSTPGYLIKMIRFSDQFKIDLKQTDIEKFLSKLIEDKDYKKDNLTKEIIYSYIELYFRNNISSKNIDLYYIYNYFIKRIHNTKIYNLDVETLLAEFQDRVLNG